MINYEEKLINKFKLDPKSLHSYVKSKQSVKDSIRVPEIEDGSIITDHELICSTLNDYFQSVFSGKGDVKMPTFENRTYSICDFSSSIFTIDAVESRLSRLDESKSKGLYSF